MWLLRFPVFCFGFDLGDRILTKSNLCKKEKSTKGLLLYVLELVSIVVILSFIYYVKEWPVHRCLIYFVICIPLMLILANLFEILPRFSSFVCAFSAVTFEIYLANHICRSIPHSFCPNIILWAMLVVVSSIALGTLVWWISQKCLSWAFHSRRQQP